MAFSRQEGERGTRNRKTEGRTDESERTRSGRRITGTADEDGREERARARTVRATDRRGTGEDVSGILRTGSLSSFPSACSFALPYLHHLKEGKEEARRAGWPTARGAALSLLFAGRSVARWLRGVAMTSPRSGRGGRPSLSMSAGTRGRSCERLAMVWTMEAADGTDERRGTGEEVGGILRPVFFQFALSSVCLFLFPIYNNIYI